MSELTLPQGTIRYEDAGSGEPIVLVHGLLVDGGLWREVVPLLARDFRVIVPHLPLGSHRRAMNSDADLAPLGQAAIIAGVLEQLGLENVTLVGNDTGGALCQLVAVHHRERLARLVLTPCDAFENFPPPAFRPLVALAHVPGAIYAVGQSMRPRAARRLPIAYGWLAKRGIPDDLSDAWLAPVLGDKRVRADLAKLLKGFSSKLTLAAAERFGELELPVLVAWAPDDRFFKMRFAMRLVDAFPDARLELIDDSYTFVSLDQPARTAELIASFASESVAAR